MAGGDYPIDVASRCFFSWNWREWLNVCPGEAAFHKPEDRKTNRRSDRAVDPRPFKSGGHVAWPGKVFGLSPYRLSLVHDIVPGRVRQEAQRIS
jgi:hypothetical protein